MTERAFPTCVACGGRLAPSWFQLRHALRPKRWGYSLHFGGRGRIRRGVDYLVEALAPDAVRGWLGREYATQMAAAVFTAALALQRAGWPMNWAVADARELERLRFLDAAVRAYGEPVSVLSARPAWVATPIEDRTMRRVDVTPRLQGDAVLEVTGDFGEVTFEERQ